jgi:hypothetical protein
MRKILAFTAGLLCAANLASAQPASPVAGPLTTATLANLCAAPAGEGELAMAQGYCRGFLIGAWQYHTEITRPGGRAAIFCLPAAGAPTLEAAQASFVTWASANAQYANDKAIDGLLRWAAATYPCPAPARAARSR